MEILEIKIEDNALIDAPIFCYHKRGKNWLASIKPNPKAPGGLERVFWERGRGPYFYIIPENLKLPVAVEFGADYYTGSGRKIPERLYGVIVKIEDDKIILEKYKTATQAIKRAKALSEKELSEELS